MSIYWAIVAIVIIFGMLMPQSGPRRKQYVLLMALVHVFVCAFRYKHLMGDLLKYNYEYLQTMEYSYLSAEVFHEGRNTGFYWLMKLVADLTNGDFQAFLIVLAVFTGVVTAVLIYRYSPKPWLSFLVWNCMTFYVTYDFCLIKQGLAMAVLMLSMMCIFEKKPVGFLLFTLQAGFIHAPALAFLPAYFIANRKLSGTTIIAYVVLAAVIYGLRTQIADLVSEMYYEETFALVEDGLGGRVMVIVIILLAGGMLKGFREEQFSQLFNLVVIAAVFQMFSSFDNVFTRLADYYLQFTILFIPMIFYSNGKTAIRRDAAPPMLPFNDRSIKLIVALLVVVLIWWYDTTCLGRTIEYEVDNFLNYRFMWEVQ